MRKLVIGAFVFGLLGCGGGDGDASPSSDAPDCADVYADGASVDDAVDVDNSTGCTDGDGVRFFGFATEGCIDGRELRWNDEGWGYQGDVWHRHETGAELVAPAAERAACTGQ